MPLSSDTEGMQPIPNAYPCPCCGYLVNALPPGYHEICPICLWEDDLAQLRFPDMPGSANHVSLVEAQHNYNNCGAAERRNANQARPPLENERQEEAWRPLNPDTDNIEIPTRGVDYANSYPQDSTVLYYWRSTYWRRLSS
jgi:hypothetical protein